MYHFSCECPSGFDGPRCQQTHHSFNGISWAWYEALSQCEQSHTSIEFITTKHNGLLLYNGPLRELGITEPEDFISLELQAGECRGVRLGFRWMMLHRLYLSNIQGYDFLLKKCMFIVYMSHGLM